MPIMEIGVSIYNHVHSIYLKREDDDKSMQGAVTKIVLVYQQLRPVDEIDRDIDLEWKH